MASEPQRGLLPRSLRMLAVAVAAVVLVLSVGGWITKQVLIGQINRVTVEFPPGYHRPGKQQNGSTNYLLVGSDSRTGTGSEYDPYGVVKGGRSDTQILAHVAADGTTTLISFPRDTYVIIPSYTDDKGKLHPAQRNKFNAAFENGGPALLVRTMEQLTGLPVDHYIEVDLAGFKKITDQLGGVDVCIKPVPATLAGQIDNLNDNLSGFHGHLGVNHLDGEAALAFVRQRHGLPEGDLDRIKRQQQFLGAVFRKASSGSVLFRPDRLVPLMSDAASSITMDQSTDVDQLLDLAQRIRSLGPDKLRFETVPTHWPTTADGADSSGLVNGASVLIYDPAGLQNILGPLRDNPADAQVTADGLPLAPPGAPPVELVVHGADDAAVARAEAVVKTAGFTVTSPPVQSSYYSKTTITYGPAAEDSARALGANLTWARLVLDPTAGTSLRLDLGEPPAGFVPQARPSQSPQLSPSPQASAPSLAPGPADAASPENTCTY
jgi:LCP family protein required for cell wall assembly